MNLLQHGPLEQFQSDPKLKELRQQLLSQPHSFAFLTGENELPQDHSESEVSSHDFSERSSESELPEVLDLVEDMEATEVPLVKMSFSVPESSLSEGSESDVSTTSHECGRVSNEEFSTSGSEVEDGPHQEISWSRVGKMATMTKGKRRTFVIM